MRLVLLFMNDLIIGWVIHADNYMIVYAFCCYQLKQYDCDKLLCFLNYHYDHINCRN